MQSPFRCLRCVLLLLTLWPATFFALAKPADAALTISPLRIIFEGRTRSADVTLINTSQQTNTYRLGWVYNQMDEFGKYTRVANTLTPALDVGKHMIFSPRQVTLPPGARQRIRLSLRKPPDLPDGEYRAHLVFQKLPNESDSTTTSEDAPERGVTLSLKVLVGFSIPVIVRTGDYDATVDLTAPEFIPASPENKGVAQLGLTLNRTGKHGTVGRVVVSWDKSDKPEKRIGLLNNVTIFPEMPKRYIRVDLNVPAVTSGNVTVTYYGDGPQRGVVLAEKTFPVGG